MPVQLSDSGLKSPLWTWARVLGDLDPRSLAYFRIGIGAVLLYDVGLAWNVIDWWLALQG